MLTISRSPVGCRPVDFSCERPEIYAPLTTKEREMVGLFIGASVIVDDVFMQGKAVLGLR